MAVVFVYCPFTVIKAAWSEGWTFGKPYAGKLACTVWEGGDGNVHLAKLAVERQRSRCNALSSYFIL
jgi:hypothetical protein